MLSVATLVIIVSGIAFAEGIHGARNFNDEVILFGAVLTIMLSTILGVVGILWWFGWIGTEPAPYLLPPWREIVNRTWGQ
jgi:hypothetical protein